MKIGGSSEQSRDSRRINSFAADERSFRIPVLWAFGTTNYAFPKKKHSVDPTFPQTTVLALAGGSLVLFWAPELIAYREWRIGGRAAQRR